MGQPLMIDLYAGLGGWAEGGLAERYFVAGFDIERHQYGDAKYPGHLVLQDALTLHGSQFKDAALIVASPPCQEFSYMAMPWSRSKQIARALRGKDEFPAGYTGSRTIAELTALFDACFRIQREACDAAGRHIPLIVENVRGAQPWVGRARFNYGSFYLWGDVPALMPITLRAAKVPMPPGGDSLKVGFQQMAKLRLEENGHKLPGFRFDGSGKSFQTASVKAASDDGLKCGGDWFGPGVKSTMRCHSSKSPARKAASAMIAKIPFALSRHIAATFKPRAAA